MIPLRSSLRTLHEIRQLPIDYSAAILAHYPRLKLGAADSIAYYGDCLADLVQDIIEETAAPGGDWVITGPAYHVLPGGPNLLCSHICERLKPALPETVSLSLAPLRVVTEGLEITDRDSLRKYHAYSTFTRKERAAVYEASRGPVVDAAVFRGRSVLFVNDIRVTGTQQDYMHRVFSRIGAKQVVWVYILTVAQEIAEREPQVEYAINNSQLAGGAEFADFLATRKVVHTSRCITRLLSYDLQELRVLLGRLDAARCREILELATAEGRFGGDLFKEKLDLLRECST